MNLSHLPDRTAEEVRVVVEREVQKIANASILQGIQTFLVPPALRYELGDGKRHLRIIRSG